VGLERDYGAARTEIPCLLPNQQESEAMTNHHIAAAMEYFRDAQELCHDHAEAEPQVQATIGLGHAVLALAQQLYDDGGGDLPISPKDPVR
jgi:hypothetical protein